jgi:hypothetical protein
MKKFVLVLFLFAVITPFIYSCSDTEYKYQRNIAHGHVYDLDGTPLQNIEVCIDDNCFSSFEDGSYSINVNLTNEEYDVYYYYAELTICATDVDGEENGGTFPSACYTIPPESIPFAYDFTLPGYFVK